MAQVVVDFPEGFRIRTVTSVIVRIVSVSIHTSSANTCANLTLFALHRVAGNAIVNTIVVFVVATVNDIRAKARPLV